MKQEKELIKNTFIIALGKFSTQIVSFLLVSLYTAKLTTEEFGSYDLIITIITFITPFITLTLEESMFRFLIDAKSKREEKSIITQTIVTIMTTLCVACVIIFLVIKLFAINTTKLFIPYVIAVVLMALMNALVRGLGKIKLYSLSNFILSVITIVLNVVLILGTSLKVDGLLLSVIIANLIMVVFLAVNLHLKDFFDIRLVKKGLMKEMLQYSIPLIPHSLSWTIINLSDRLIITSFMGTSSNGIYAVSNKFPTIINTVYNYFAIAWKESAAKALHEDNSEKYYNRIYGSLRNLVYSATVCVIAVVPFIFGFLVKGNGYQTAFLYIPILVFSVYFSNMASFYGGIFSAYKQTKIIGSTTVVAAIINVVINLIFIKVFGLYAAAISTLLSSVFLYIYRKIKIKDFVKLKHSKDMNITIVMTLVVFLAYYSNNVIFQVVSLLFSMIYALMMNKMIVRDFLGRFVKR
ncbi:MAG: oligosaccharide flippase family protein [Clostridia bacterium]|nr:oligosaccharide flippase family protein [Clostridia bacterium]